MFHRILPYSTGILWMLSYSLIIIYGFKHRVSGKATRKLQILLKDYKKDTQKESVMSAISCIFVMILWIQ